MESLREYNCVTFDVTFYLEIESLRDYKCVTFDVTFRTERLGGTNDV